MSESIWIITISVEGELQRFTVDAVKFADAVKLASAIEQGIRSNPAARVTEVLGVTRVDLEPESVYHEVDE